MRPAATGSAPGGADRAAELDALVAQAPVGLAIFDRDLRLVRINEALRKVVGGAPVGDHPRPEELDPVGEVLDAATMAEVVATGVAPPPVLRSRHDPSRGGEAHWRVGHIPILDAAGAVAALGTSVEDVTDEMVGRRRGDLLQRLSEAFAGAVTAQHAAELVVDVVAQGLTARSLFAQLDDDGTITVRSASGYVGADVEAWREARLDQADPGPLATTIRTATRTTTAADDIAPESLERTLRQAAGDRTVLWQPVLGSGDSRARAAIGVAWPYPRIVTAQSLTLLQTLGALSGLALTRLEMSEQSEQDRFRSAMDAMIDSVVIAHSLRDDEDEIVDFEIDFVNAGALRATERTLDAVVGQRVCELYPAWRTTGLFDQVARVVRTGEPYVVEEMHYQDTARDGRRADAFWNMQVVKVDDGFIVASRDVTTEVQARRAAEEARRVAERERLAVELLQRAALPTSLPRVEGIRLSARYRPARDAQPVGGDWYDAFSVDERTLAVVIADVAGHGQEAAAAMLQVRNIFRAVAIEHRDPATVLGRVGAVLQRLELEHSPFVTCCYGTIDVVDGTFRWSLAGHPPPVIARHGAPVRLGEVAPGPPLATSLPPTYRTASVVLGPDDLIVLYTDGLVERRGEVIDVGLARLRAQVADLPDRTADDLAEHLADEVPSPDDDVAVLCVRMGPRGGP